MVGSRWTPTMVRPNWTYQLLALSLLCVFSINGQSSPTCTNTFIELSVTEPSTTTFALHDFTTAPDCTDPDGGAVTYTILSGDANSRFTIASNELVVNGALLDAEANDGAGNYESPYKMIIEATDAEGLSAYVSVLVQVVSDNDNDPTIVLASNSVSFTESTGVGATISTCALADLDYPGGQDAKVSVSITDGNDGTFAINSDTCDVTLVESLNYDLNSTYSLTLEVTDLDPVSPKTATQVLTINVLDENDVEPTCPFYNTMVEVDENTSGTIATLMCSDDDALPLVYTKNSGDSMVKVDISGMISLDSPGPDYDTGDRNLEIQVLVTDQGNPIRSVTVTYSLSVVDLDD
ncbi:hypothetical protein EGW08_006441, partial [Elysia chlorotica]